LTTYRLSSNLSSAISHDSPWLRSVLFVDTKAEAFPRFSAQFQCGAIRVLRERGIEAQHEQLHPPIRSGLIRVEALMRPAIEAGLIVVAFFCGRFWQWIKDAKGAMRARDTGRRR
jgi:hypothetical protein